MPTSACGTSPHDWRYVSEGGANIVLAYRGPPHPTFSQHLLRLVKSSARATPHRQVAFQTRVVIQVLSPDFLLPFRVVKVSREWLREINQQLAESRVRPRDREEKGGIDEGLTEALLVRDMVSGEGVFTVEIKPKWGFLPPSKLRPNDLESTLDACRFCKHTLYRERGQGQVALEAHRTGYCPLDLYSMVPQRSERALDSLWSSWERTMGETNNFRLFWGGDRLVPTAESILALETSLGTPPLGFIKAHLPSQLNRILPLLSVLQSQHHLPSIHTISTSAVAPTLEDFEALIGQNDPSVRDGAEGDVTAALLSGTFKDCSILVRFCRLDGGDWDIETKVIDLEEKSVLKIEGWQILERSIQENWEDLLRSVEREGSGTIRECTV